MAQHHGGFLLPIMMVLLCFMPQSAYAQNADVLISEVLINPIGSDTGQEFVEVFNTSSHAIDLSQWDLDPGALPYFTFPQGTILEANKTLTVYLRKSGTNQEGVLFTGSTFGSSDMTNTKGSVALFSSTTHTKETLVDFLQYGDVGQTHESSAIEMGIWAPSTTLMLGVEGLSYQRVCLEKLLSCFALDLSPTPEQTQINKTDAVQQIPPQTASGSGLENNTSTESGTLLTEVQIGSGGVLTSSGGNIPIPIHESSLSQTTSGTTLQPIMPVPVVSVRENRPPIPKIRIQAKGVATGVVPFPLNITGEESSDDVGITNYLWDYGNGHTYQGKNPLEYIYDSPGEYTITLTVIDTEGVAVSAQLVIQVYSKSDGISSSPPTQTSIVPTGISNVSTIQGIQTTTNSVDACVSMNMSDIKLSELLPNPNGKDKGREWVELYNPTDQALCLKGMILEEGVKKIQKYVFSTVLIGPKGYLVLTDTLMKLALDNVDGMVRLMTPEGQEIDRVKYSKAPSGKSWSRKGY